MRDHLDCSDAELLVAVADGDTSALRVLYERNAAWISVRLMRRCNDAGLVAEVLQDAFVAAWRGAAAYRGEGDVGGWLWGIAIRRLASRVRSDRRRPTVPFTDIAEGGLEASVEERVLSGVEYGDLGSAFARLSPEMRSVLQATVLDGLTEREAAHLLGVQRGTVKSRLHRAKAQLRRDLMEGLT